MIRRSVQVDGEKLSFCEAGPADGPAIVLLHGLLSDNTTWDAAIGPLAAHGLRVVSLDLPGHGHSGKPRGLYLLDDFAIYLAGLLDALDIESATVCGHSLGGAIAMHFAYHYPTRADRLVLVAAGGLGRQVSPALRALAMPGAQSFAGAVLGSRPVGSVLRRRALYRLLRIPPDRMPSVRRVGRTLMRPDMRSAFFASLRGVVTPGGQRGSYVEMGRLTARVPTLLVWSQRDAIIPVSHAHTAHASLPGSRLVVFDEGGHDPHVRNAVAFADEVAEFCLNR